MSISRTDSVRAARCIYDSDGALTPDGLVQLTALETGTANGVVAYRRERRRRTWNITRGGGILFTFMSLVFISVAFDNPSLYWTCSGLSFLGIGALIIRDWRGAFADIKSNAAAAHNHRAGTIETWKRISAMPEDEYAQLLQRSQVKDAAGGVARTFAGPAVAVVKFAGKFALTEKLADALDILDYVDGYN